MGEAKRRQPAGERGAPVRFIDEATGEPQLGRLAPSVFDLLRANYVIETRDRAGERVSKPVPCNGCTACCDAVKVRVHAARESPEDLQHLDLIPEPDAVVAGSMLLRKREDGACVHLGPTGCTVYEHRPRTCRMFDCRIGAVAGLREHFGPDNHPSPPWVPAQHNARDRAWTRLLIQASQEYIARQGDAAWEPSDAAEYAYGKLDAALRAQEGETRRREPTTSR